MSTEYNDKFNMFYETEPVIPGKNVFAYVKFPSLERAVYGVYLTNGGPTGEEIDSEAVGETSYDPTTIAPLTDLSDAVRVLENGDSLEEFPYVEIKDEAQFNKLVEAAHKNRDDEVYTGSGVYLIAGTTWNKNYESAEAYEREEMKAAADDLIEDLFSGEELKEAANLILVKNNMEPEE